MRYNPTTRDASHVTIDMMREQENKNKTIDLTLAYIIAKWVVIFTLIFFGYKALTKMS